MHMRIVVFERRVIDSTVAEPVLKAAGYPQHIQFNETVLQGRGDV